jgi:hypothetical protein
MNNLDPGIITIDRNKFLIPNNLVKVYYLIDGVIDFEKSDIQNEIFFFMPTKNAKGNNMNYKLEPIASIEKPYLVKDGEINLELLSEYEKILPDYTKKGISNVIKFLTVDTKPNLLEKGLQARIEVGLE